VVPIGTRIATGASAIATGEWFSISTPISSTAETESRRP
jgi:hypothetical protein